MKNLWDSEKRLELSVIFANGGGIWEWKGRVFAQFLRVAGCGN